jgi:hypothetical protein
MQMKNLFFELVLLTIKTTENELLKVFKRHY